MTHQHGRRRRPAAMASEHGVHRRPSPGTSGCSTPQGSGTSQQLVEAGVDHQRRDERERRAPCRTARRRPTAAASAPAGCTSMKPSVSASRCRTPCWPMTPGRKQPGGAASAGRRRSPTNGASLRRPCQISAPTTAPSPAAISAGKQRRAEILARRRRKALDVPEHRERQHQQHAADQAVMNAQSGRGRIGYLAMPTAFIAAPKLGVLLGHELLRTRPGRHRARRSRAASGSP